MSLAETFKSDLQRLEQERSVDIIVKHFSDDATLKRLTPETYKGKSEAETFWQEYLDTFKTQETAFSHTTTADGTAVLEWTSKGELPNGQPFEYSGVSVLEHDGDKVSAFRTYYDSATFAELKK